jgi:hypothetical protein
MHPTVIQSEWQMNSRSRIWPVTACLTLIVLLSLYPLVHRYRTVNSFVDLANSLVPNVVVVLLTYLVLWGLFERNDAGVVGQVALRLRELLRPGTAGVEAITRKLPTDDYHTLLNTALQVEVVVRWTQFDGIALRNFFISLPSKPGGVLHLFVPDPKLPATAAVSDEQRPGSLSAAIRTIQLITQVRIALDAVKGRDNQFHLHLMPHAPNYTAYCFDRRLLYLKPVEMAFKMTHRLPTQRINLGVDEGYRLFWSNEMDGLAVRYPASVDWRAQVATW